MKLCITSTSNTFSGGVQGGTPPWKWKKYQWALRNTGCYGPRLVLLLRKIPCPLSLSVTLPSERRVERKSMAFAAELVVFWVMSSTRKSTVRSCVLCFWARQKFFSPVSRQTVWGVGCSLRIIVSSGIADHIIETWACMKSIENTSCSIL